MLAEVCSETVVAETGCVSLLPGESFKKSRLKYGLENFCFFVFKLPEMILGDIMQ